MPTAVLPAAGAAAPRAASTAASRADGAAHAVHSSLELLDELYAYNHWLYDKVRPFIGEEVCEIGSGTGNITQFLLNRRRVVGIEPFGPSLACARARFRPHLNVRFAECRIEDCPNRLAPAATFDAVVCLNVLEHIEDDVGCLARMRALCRPAGRVVVLVPAHMSAFGRIDESFGHCRRYNRRTLGAAFASAGLQVQRSFYLNAPGYFGWLWHSRVRRCTHIPAARARQFNRLVPFIDALERLIPPPFGQSLVMVGTPVAASAVRLAGPDAHGFWRALRSRWRRNTAIMQTTSGRRGRAREDRLIPGGELVSTGQVEGKVACRGCQEAS